MSKHTPEPSVLVVSQNPDFAHPVAEMVTHELSLNSGVAENAAAAKAMLGSVSLVVTTEALGEDFPCPVLQVKQLPVKMHELLNDIADARQKTMADDVQLGRGYKLLTRQKQVMHSDASAPVALTDKEVQLLQSLAGGKTVAKEQLLKHVWGIDAALETHTLETHIYRLRGKLRELADDDMIVAVDGGYKLAGK